MSNESNHNKNFNLWFFEACVTWRVTKNFTLYFWNTDAPFSQTWALTTNIYTHKYKFRHQQAQDQGGLAKNSEKIMKKDRHWKFRWSCKDSGLGMTIDWRPDFTTTLHLQVDISGDYVDSFLLFVCAWLRFGGTGPKVLQQL